MTFLELVGQLKRLPFDEIRKESDGYFEFVISSADYGIRKPHGVIFLSAVSKLSLKPSEVWYVGDSLERDILGANQCQMPAIWYNRQQQEHGGIARPEAEVRSWEEFTVMTQRYL